MAPRLDLNDEVRATGCLGALGVNRRRSGRRWAGAWALTRL